MRTDDHAVDAATDFLNEIHRVRTRRPYADRVAAIAEALRPFEVTFGTTDSKSGPLDQLDRVAGMLRWVHATWEQTVKDPRYREAGIALLDHLHDLAQEMGQAVEREEVDALALLWQQDNTVHSPAPPPSFKPANKARAASPVSAPSVSKTARSDTQERSPNPTPRDKQIVARIDTPTHTSMVVDAPTSDPVPGDARTVALIAGPTRTAMVVGAPDHQDVILVGNEAMASILYAITLLDVSVVIDKTMPATAYGYLTRGADVPTSCTLLVPDVVREMTPGFVPARFLDDPRNGLALAGEILHHLLVQSPQHHATFARRHETWSALLRAHLETWTKALAVCNGQVYDDPTAELGHLISWAGGHVEEGGLVPSSTLRSIRPADLTANAYFDYIERLVAQLVLETRGAIDPTRRS